MPLNQVNQDEEAKKLREYLESLRTNIPVSDTMDTVRNSQDAVVQAEQAEKPNPYRDASLAASQERTDMARDAYDYLTGSKVPDVEIPEQSVPEGTPAYLDPAQIGSQPAAKEQLQADVKALSPVKELQQTQQTSLDVSVEPVAPVSSVSVIDKASPYATQQNQLEHDHGFPAGYLSATATIESGNNPNAKNPNSSASGLYQFTADTAQEFGLTDPFDPVASTDAMVKLTKRNQEHLRKVLGREPTGEELYLAHQQGATGALKLLESPDKLAVEVVGRDQVLLNGGHENMTAREYAQLWGNKYNKVGGKEPVTSGVPTTAGKPEEPVYGRVDVEQPEETPIDIAKRNAQPDENGIRTIKASEGVAETTPYKFQEYKTSDSSAMWQGLLAGGIAMLGAKLLGADDDEMAEVFLMAGTNQFTGLLNRSARSGNIEALQQQGYDDASIEEWIATGDRTSLKEKKTTPWVRQADGTFMRNLPNGDVQFMGEPEAKVAYKDKGVPDENGLQKVTEYDKKGVELRSYNEYVKPTAAAKGKGAAATKPTTFLSPDGRERVTGYRTADGSFVDVQGNALTIPLDWDPVNDREAAQQRKLNNDQKKNVKEQIQQYHTHQIGIGKLLDKNRDPDTGKLSTTYKHNRGNAATRIAVDAVVNDLNWGLFGGGEGTQPVFGDTVTGLIGNEVRDMFTDDTTLRGNVRNAAIAAARAAGAVGINTQAEVKMYEQSVPQLDYTSYENYVASKEKIKGWYDDEMAKLDAKLQAEGYTLNDLLGGKYLSDESGEGSSAKVNPTQNVAIPEGKSVAPALADKPAVDEGEWKTTRTGQRYRVIR